MGTINTGRINPFASTRSALRVKKRKCGKGYSQTEGFKGSKKGDTKDFKKTVGIDLHEINRRKSEGEYLRCAWPSDRNATHRVTDCIRPIKMDKGTANCPKANLHRIEDLEISSEATSDTEDGSNEE